MRIFQASVFWGRFPLALSVLLISILSFADFAFASNKNGPTDGDLGLQRSVTPVMDFITSFNNYWLVPIMIGIVLFVTILMIYIMFRFREKANPEPSKTTHNTFLEVVWTIIPVLILLAIVFPSMKLLYFQDKIPEAELVVKVTGNTWYWEYSYPEYDNIDTIVSNMVDLPAEEKFGLSHDEIITKINARPDGEPKLNGRPYLLATDAPLVVPVDTVVKLVVTSNTNMHAFAVPQFGIKIDAIPGRLNETWFKVHKGEEGQTFYGQCSEICGVNHSFMPIEVKVVSKEEFKRWVANNGSFTTRLSYNDNQKINGTVRAVSAK